MIEMFVTAIALDIRNNNPLVILNDSSKKRALPIWIGQPEAQAIARALEGFESQRPLTHDLMLEIVDLSGYKVHHIEINDLNDNTYYAAIILESSSGELVSLDSRPSDAITLSLKTDCPIMITQDVYDQGTVPTEMGLEEADEDDDTEAFKNFIQNVKASDFKLDDDRH